MQYKKIDYNTVIISVLIISFSLITICTVLQLSNIVSLLFTGTFIFVAGLFILNIKKTRITILDGLTVFIMIMAFFNVIINASYNNFSVSFNYLRKVIMFSEALVFFVTVLKAKVNIYKINKLLFYAITFISIFFIIMFLTKKNLMYIFNGSVSKYLCFNFDNPNKAALFILSIAMFEYIFAFKEKNKILKVFLFTISVMLTYFLYETQSRNALIVLLIFIFICINIRKKNSEKKLNKLFLKFSSIWPALFVTFYFSIMSNEKIMQWFEFMISEGKSLTSRMTVWDFALDSFYGSPIFGAYYEISYGQGISQMHNTHLDVLSSYGLIVFILFVIILYLILKETNLKIKTKEQKICLVAFICILFTGMGEATLFAGSTGLFIIIGGLLLLANNNNT